MPPATTVPTLWGDIPILLTASIVPAKATFLLAHGAGAPMDSDFMSLMALAIAEQGFDVVRFEFPYMQQRRTTGKKSPPSPMPKLLQFWQQLLDCAQEHTTLPLVLSGKSMGGRTASLVAANEGGVLTAVTPRICAAVCFGYPFHPPAKLEKTRVGHLKSLALPLSIFQGTRDPFGKPSEVLTYSLSDSVTLNWLDTGDHDFKPLKRSGRSQQDLILEAARKAGCWIHSLIERQP